MAAWYKVPPAVIDCQPFNTLYRLSPTSTYHLLDSATSTTGQLVHVWPLILNGQTHHVKNVESAIVFKDCPQLNGLLVTCLTDKIRFHPAQRTPKLSIWSGNTPSDSSKLVIVTSPIIAQSFKTPLTTHPQKGPTQACHPPPLQCQPGLPGIQKSVPQDHQRKCWKFSKPTRTRCLETHLCCCFLPPINLLLLAVTEKAHLPQYSLFLVHASHQNQTNESKKSTK